MPYELNGLPGSLVSRLRHALAGWDAALEGPSGDAELDAADEMREAIADVLAYFGLEVPR